MKSFPTEKRKVWIERRLEKMLDPDQPLAPRNKTAEITKSILKQSVWIQGILAALALVTAMDDFFGWEKVEFLELTHAVIVIWDHHFGQFLEYVASWLPFNMSWTSAERNLMLFLGLTALPGYQGIMLFFLKKKIAEEDDGYKEHTTKLILKFLNFVFSFILGFLFLVFFTVFGIVDSPEGTGLLNPKMNPLFARSLLGVIIVAGFIGLWLERRRYFFFIVFVITFISTLELWYFLPSIKQAAQDVITYSQSLDDL